MARETMVRERLVELGLATVLAAALSSELLGAVHWLARPAIAMVWIGIAVFWVWGLRGLRLKLERDWVVAAITGAVAGLWLVEGLRAIVSPPNSSDAMAYHMPRVIYWIQQQCVDFFCDSLLEPDHAAAFA